MACAPVASVLSTLLAVQLALSILGAGLATFFDFRERRWVRGRSHRHDPGRHHGDSKHAHRAHLASAPPSTIMTGTTTQIMMDLGT